LVIEAIKRQFGSIWSGLRDGISKCSEELWRDRDNPRSAPSRLVYHTVQTVEYYLGDTRDFDWNARFSVNWEYGNIDDLPSREQLLAYIDEIEAAVQQRLQNATPEQLAGPDPGPWGFQSAAERWLYMLRHSQHHLGQMALVLRRAGLEPGIWR